MNFALFTFELTQTEDTHTMAVYGKKCIQWKRSFDENGQKNGKQHRNVETMREREREGERKRKETEKDGSEYNDILCVCHSVLCSVDHRVKLLIKPTKCRFEHTIIIIYRCDRHIHNSVWVERIKMIIIIWKMCCC